MLLIALATDMRAYKIPNALTYPAAAAVLIFHTALNGMSGFLFSLLGMGVGTLLVGLTPGWALGMAVVAFVIVGFMNPIANGPLHAIMQSRIEPEMVERMYAAVDSRLWPAAGRSVLAHLIDLEARGQVMRDGEGWKVAA